MTSTRHSRGRRRLPSALALACLALFPRTTAAQTTGDPSAIPGRPSTAPPDPVLASGTLATRPDGGFFVADDHQSGSARALHLADLRWGRLVEVLAISSSGAIDPRPLLRDFVIGQDVVDDGVNYRLIGNLDTGAERLVVLRVPGAPEPAPGAGTFEELLLAAEQNLALVAPRDPSAPPPFSTVARNAVLVARFDDLLDDGPEEAVDLYTTVRLWTGNGLVFTRTLFDPNHGGIRRGRFHSTRVLVDPVIEELDVQEAPIPLPLKTGGLPEASALDALANLVLRIPTRTFPPIGQVALLTNLRGRALSTGDNGPVDLGSPTMDVVRGFRSGTRDDPHRGYLFDDQPPALVGDFAATIDAAVDDPAGEAGFAFVVDMTFTSPCRLRPVQANALRIGDRSLEVVENATGGSPSGEVTGVRVRLQGRQPATPGDLLGEARFLSPYRPAPFPAICWTGFSFVDPDAAPGTLVSPAAFPKVRFSEGMDLGSVSPLETFRVVRGDGSQPSLPQDIVVATLIGNPGARTFLNFPVGTFDHTQGVAEPYHVELIAGPDALTDLAGNPVGALPSGLDFTLDPAAPGQASGGIVLTFESLDELPGPGAPDVRGNFFVDLGRSLLRPRPVQVFSVAADADKPVPSLMIPFAPGVQTPLSPLGSKLQTVWRYADLGWNVHDETKYDVDVVGLSWAPVGGVVVSDFFPQFEMRLAHGNHLPDEQIDANLLPRYPSSGLPRTEPFAGNVLADPLSPQEIVHPRSLGYEIDPADLYVGQSGRTMIPFPLNRGDGPLRSYTWRDTAVRAQAGPDGAGVPLDVEAGPPLFLEPAPGTLAGPGEVPSIGLPLLMEFRCFPSDTALGLNAMAVSLAINSSALPAFRVHSTGGFDTQGNAVLVDPDLATMPSGGFNPNNGFPTPAGDNVFQIGQIDLATRISRVHTVWMDTGAFAQYLTPVLESNEPTGTGVQVEVRGAVAFTGSTGELFDATRLDAYGEVDGAQVVFLNGASDWTSDWSSIDGARYFQVRFTFVGDVDTGATAELEALGVAFLR